MIDIMVALLSAQLFGKSHQTVFLFTGNSIWRCQKRKGALTMKEIWRKITLTVAALALCTGLFLGNASTADAATTTKTTTTTSTSTKTTKKVYKLTTSVKTSKTSKTTTKTSTALSNTSTKSVKKVTTVQTTVTTVMSGKTKTVTTTVKTTVKTTTTVKTVPTNQVVAATVLNGKVPSNVIKGLQTDKVKIVLYSTDSKLVKAKANGYYDAARNRIDIKDGNINVLIHEVGHYVAYKTGNQDQTTQFKQIFAKEKAKFPGTNKSYAISSQSEYFAECFLLYYTNPTALKKAAPSTYNYIAKTVKMVGTSMIGTQGSAGGLTFTVVG